MKERFEGILRRIRAASPHSRPPQLIAVSKSQTTDAIRELYALGQRDFGENYAQELIEKARLLQAEGLAELRWHFIGHLQSNKVKTVLPWIHAIHSVESLSVAREILKFLPREKRDFPIFIQINLDEEPTKSGLLPQTLSSFLKELLSLPQSGKLRLEGLMTIPAPHSMEPFKRLAALSKDHQPPLGDGLSMGMSEDFELAVREGATHVRVGSALFGQRPV